MVPFILALCIFTIPAHSLTIGQEGAINAVPIRFYQMLPNQWFEEDALQLATVLATELNTYCTVNYTHCGLKYWSENFEFVPGHMIPLELDKDRNYPYEEVDGVSVKVYMEYRSSVPAADAANGTTAWVLPYAALEAVVLAKYLVISDAVGRSVVGVGATTLTPKPDYLTNLIMSILALILLLVVLLVALGCWIYAERERKADEAYRNEIFEERKRQEKLARKHRESPNKIAPTQETRRSYKVAKKREPSVFTVEEPKPKHKKKKSKKTKKHEETFRVQSTPFDSTMDQSGIYSVIGDESVIDGRSIGGESSVPGGGQVYVTKKSPSVRRGRGRGGVDKAEENADTNITVVPMPDGAASFAYKAASDDEADNEDYDSAYHDSNNGHHQQHQQRRNQPMQQQEPQQHRAYRPQQYENAGYAVQADDHQRTHTRKIVTDL